MCSRSVNIPVVCRSENIRVYREIAVIRTTTEFHFPSTGYIGSHSPNKENGFQLIPQKGKKLKKNRKAAAVCTWHEQFSKALQCSVVLAVKGNLVLW